MEILVAIGAGADDRAAGASLKLSEKTVHTHRQNIMRKLGVQTRSGLLTKAIQCGLVRITTQAVLRTGLRCVQGSDKTAPFLGTARLRKPN